MLPTYLYSDLPKLREHKLFAEIDTDALTYNYKLLSARTRGTHHICVVKADAYGHAADICVRTLLSAGCRFFAVSCIEEAISVREICKGENIDAEVLILGYTDPKQASLLSENNIIQTLLSYDYAEKLNLEATRAGVCIRAHAALDTGMNRIGISACSEEECFKATVILKKVAKFESISLEGLFTHFSRADEGTDEAKAFTDKQFKRFSAVRSALGEAGIFLFCHASNSAAALSDSELALDGVRLGIVLYGVMPSEHIGISAELGLKPVMSLKTLICHTHTLLPGESVSYGGLYSADEERVIATIPIGYADGFIRAYGGYKVTVSTGEGNFKAPIVGRICMDQCMIDITGIPA
ncbi:MAG: alanine racemase, partial [Clostridia bacterium]|nr:alanine racemase [Clostridia bacterium]